VEVATPCWPAASFQAMIPTSLPIRGRRAWPKRVVDLVGRGFGWRSFALQPAGAVLPPRAAVVGVSRSPFHRAGWPGPRRYAAGDSRPGGEGGIGPRPPCCGSTPPGRHQAFPGRTAAVSEPKRTGRPLAAPMRPGLADPDGRRGACWSPEEGRDKSSLGSWLHNASPAITGGWGRCGCGWKASRTRRHGQGRLWPKFPGPRAPKGRAAQAPGGGPIPSSVRVQRTRRQSGKTVNCESPGWSSATAKPASAQSAQDLRRQRRTLRHGPDRAAGRSAGIALANRSARRLRPKRRRRPDVGTVV